MNQHRFTYYGTLPNLNDYIKAERMSYRRNGALHTKGNDMKQQCQRLLIEAIRGQMRRQTIKRPVYIRYVFYEPNRRRDLDNVAATAHKFIQDSLVICKVLQNDGWEWIKGFSDEFYIDRLNPRIEVTLVEEEQIE